MKKGLKIFLLILLLLLASAATFLATLFLGGFGKIPSKQDLINLQNETATLVLSNSQEPIGKFFSENRTNVPYNSLPKNLINALIATEDARFYSHEGVDGRALLRVLLKTILIGDRSSGGGSTLSQQLAKNLFGRNNYGKISIGVNKLKEIILANRLEEVYSKEKILELYLNTVPFGENIYGIEVAALRFFSVHVKDLKIEQAAVLVGILKANTRYNPRLHPENALDRRAVVFQQMHKYNYITSQELDSLNKLDLKLNYSNLSLNDKAPYFLQQLKPELESILSEIEKETGVIYDYRKDGLIINSTLDHNLQLAGKSAMKKHLSLMQKQLNRLYKNEASKSALEQLANKIAKHKRIEIEDKHLKKRNLFYWEEKQADEKLTIKDSLMHTLKQLHAGLLGMNPQSGAILSWIGGIDYDYYQFDQILAKRQLASTFKPFLYAEAIRNGRKPCDYLSNESIELKDYDNWSPQNYDGESGGSYSMAAALAYSKNLPTVHLYFETEQKKLAQLWSQFGFIDALNEDPSVILGTNSVSMLELAVAYSVFANGGKLVEPYTIESIYNKEHELIYQRKENKFQEVIEQKVASQINGILEKAINEGTGISLRNTYQLNIPFAGKTGTSQNFADAWFVGYNKHLLLVSRVGASYPNIHFNNGAYGSGGRLALPIVGLTLSEALKNQELGRQMRNAQLTSVKLYDCEDFKKSDLIDQVFKLFKKKDSNLDQERKKAKKKKKVKGFFKSVFGSN